MFAGIIIELTLAVDLATVGIATGYRLDDQGVGV
jgi:hypothetical protein